MNITFRHGSESISEKLVRRAEGKINGLARFINEQNYEAQVHVDIERESGSQSSDSMWRTSINLDLAGDRFNATETGKTPEKSTDLAIKELKGEITRARTKKQSLFKQGTNMLKRLRQGFEY